MGQSESKYSVFEKTLPDVPGKVFAITGTTSGTGFIAARTVADHKGTVVLLNRPSERSKSSLEKLREAVPGGIFVPIDCDLQDFASCRRACAEIESRYPDGLYCLCNNAGIMATPDDLTKDGYVQDMQTNHLSHFLLTKELYPLLKKSADRVGDARIVQHSSVARHGTRNGLEAPCLTKQEADGMLGGNSVIRRWERYGQTKLANSVFCHALDGKLKAAAGGTKILSLCAHPGYSETNLANHLMGSWEGSMIGALGSYLRQSQTADDGAMGILRCMMAPPETLKGGTIYGPAGITRFTGFYGDAVPLPATDHETDGAAADLLWELSEKAIGAVFEV